MIQVSQKMQQQSVFTFIPLYMHKKDVGFYTVKWCHMVFTMITQNSMWLILVCLIIWFQSPNILVIQAFCICMYVHSGVKCRSVNVLVFFHIASRLSSSLKAISGHMWHCLPVTVFTACWFSAFINVCILFEFYVLFYQIWIFNLPFVQLLLL